MRWVVYQTRWALSAVKSESVPFRYYLWRDRPGDGARWTSVLSSAEQFERLEDACSVAIKHDAAVEGLPL